MKIAVIGASGNAGSRITAELARRGHAVTAIARHPEKIAAQANVTGPPLNQMQPRTVAGETGPFKHTSINTAPLAFMRALFCIQPACTGQTHFDMWAHHPYTSGSPWHHATERDAVSLADLTKMHALIVYAAQHHKTASLSLFPQRLWVTEFTWDTRL